MAEAQPPARAELVPQAPGRGIKRRSAAPPPPSWVEPGYTAREHRIEARNLARSSMYHLTQLMRWPELLQPRTVLAIYREACDRAGFLGGAQLAAAESARWKMAAEALAAPGLSDEKRSAMLAELQAREREVLGEVNEAAEAGWSDVGTDE